jgi:hypothetical protein
MEFLLQCGANLRQVERNSSKVTKPSPSKSRRCKYRDIRSLLIGAHYRVDRVLSFFSSRWNWDFATSERGPPPTLFPGGGPRSLAREGVGGPNSNEETRHTLYMYVFCDAHLQYNKASKKHLNRWRCTSKKV